MKEESRLTPRAPDGWESARFMAGRVAGGWFRQNGILSSRPPAGNASRWVAIAKRLVVGNDARIFEGVKP